MRDTPGSTGSSDDPATLHEWAEFNLPADARAMPLRASPLASCVARAGASRAAVAVQPERAPLLSAERLLRPFLLRPR